MCIPPYKFSNVQPIPVRSFVQRIFLMVEPNVLYLAEKTYSFINLLQNWLKAFCLNMSFSVIPD